MSLDSKVNQLRSELIIMARKAEAPKPPPPACLHTPSEALVAEVREMDHDIDETELKLDRVCMGLLVLQEPYGVDFRFIFSASRIVHELERVGDQSKTVAKWAPRMPSPPDGDMEQLVMRTREALQTAVRSLVERDTEQADRVMAIEFQVDELEDRIIESEPSLAEAFIAKALERIGDLATNIAESVIFSLDAEDVRHGRFRR